MGGTETVEGSGSGVWVGVLSGIGCNIPNQIVRAFAADRPARSSAPYAPAPRAAQGLRATARKNMSNLGLSVAPQRRTSPARRDRNRLFRQPRDQRRIVGRLGDDADMAAGHISAERGLGEEGVRTGRTRW